jgi:hypothetical protein
MMTNKGFLGLVNFVDTPLEVKENDKFIVSCLKGAGQGTIEGLLTVGTAVVALSLLVRHTNKEE